MQLHLLILTDGFITLDLFLHLYTIMNVVGEHAEGCKEEFSSPVDVYVVPAIDTGCQDDFRLLIDCLLERGIDFRLDMLPLCAEDVEES